LKSQQTRTAFACAFGTVFEWYDMVIFATAAALVFNTLFFPTMDPMAGMLAAMLTYAVGYIARPLGGILFGHWGDRYGRKNALMTTMLLMGFATFLIGLMPTYASIGIWAPIGLVVLRILQGIAFGGEWGGASIMILETAPTNRRGLYGSFIQAGWPIGILMSMGVFGLVSMLPQEQFMDWGWRIPFLLSLVLVVIGAFVRNQLAESPVFEKIQKDKQIVRVPLLTTLREFKSLAMGIGLKMTEVTFGLIAQVWMIVYATKTLGIPKQDVIGWISISMVVMLMAIPLFGYLSDIVGRRRVFLTTSVIALIMAWPVMWLLGNGYVLAAIMLATVVCCAPMFATIPAYLPEIFAGRVRYTGASFGCQVAAALGGGLGPAMAAYLSVAHGLWAVSIMLAGCAVITFISAWFAPETANKDLA